MKDILNINLSGKINVIFYFPKQSFSLLNYKEVEENVNLYKKYTLQKQFKDFILSNPYLIKYRNSSFFLHKNKRFTQLNENKTISQLGLKNGDIIYISNFEPKVETDEICNSERVVLPEKEGMPLPQRGNEVHNLPKKKRWLFKILVLITFIITFFLWPRKKHLKIKKKKKLLVNKAYPVNRLFIFKSKQLNEIKIEGEKINNTNATQNFNKTSDFIFITRDAYVEKNENTLIEKEWYTGYIGIFHLIQPNETHVNHIIYDKNINDFLNLTKKDLNKQDVYYQINGSNFCFIKLDFYQNGEIKNIYLPEGFLLSYYSYIEEIIKLLIPKISKNLYIESIDEKLNEIIQLNNNNTTNDSNNEEKENESDLRNLKLKKKKKNKYYKKRLSNDESENDNNNQVNNSEISYTIEDYLTPPLTESIEYELREAKIINDSFYDNNTSDMLIDNNTLNNNNFSNLTNLTECAIKGIETEAVKMEGGLINTTIYSLIDSEGFLQSVNEISTSLMKSPEESEEENDEETDNLYSQIYNNNNQITLQQAKETDKEELQKNKISFGVDFLFTNSSNIVNCTSHFINEEINKKLFKYFDSFEYNLYTNDINNSNYSIEIEVDEGDDAHNRFLSENKISEISYYGMKIITYMKQLYKYNLIGMKMESQIYTEINPSTGRLDVYTIMNFGNKNSKIKIEEQISNNHIILERSNQMGYKLLQLLNQTNFELIERNKNYTEVILEFETNFTNHPLF